MLVILWVLCKTPWHLAHLPSLSVSSSEASLHSLSPRIDLTSYKSQNYKVQRDLKITQSNAFILQKRKMMCWWWAPQGRSWATCISAILTLSWGPGTIRCSGGINVNYKPKEKIRRKAMRQAACLVVSWMIPPGWRLRFLPTPTNNSSHSQPRCFLNCQKYSGTFGLGETGLHLFTFSYLIVSAHLTVHDVGYKLSDYTHIL